MNRDVSKPNNDGERELLDRAVKALETEFATKTCNKQIASEDAISRSSIKQKLQEHHDFYVKAYGGFSNLPQNDKSRVDEINACIAMVVNEPPVTPKQEPCEDTVSLEVFEQVMWARDVAIEQLKELGYGFGEKPKTGHWIIIDDCEKFIAKCSECGRIEDSRMISKYPYCHCGAKMSENPTGSESEGV